MTVPINNLKRRNHALGDEIRDAIERVLAAGSYCLGAEVEAFEREFAAYCAVDCCTAVASGSDALEIALRALGVDSGDRVLTAANAGGYSTTAIRQVGAVPVYVDIDRGSLCMDPDAFSRTATGDCKAVIVTHLYGRLADIEQLCSLAEKLGIAVIEDCAQAHGARRGGKVAGSFGLIGCYSFYPTKNLGALGDAGALVTSDREIHERLRMLRQYGWDNKYHAAVEHGRNSRMDELQAAVLRTKLPHLDRFNLRRREIAAAYSGAFAAIPNLVLPGEFGPDAVAHLYCIRHPQRDLLRSRLQAAGVGTDIHYPVPDYLQPGFGVPHSARPHLPETERACAELLSLPCFPELRDDELDVVIRAVSEALS